MKSPLIEPLEARIAPAVISIAAPADSPKNEGSLVGGKTSFDFIVSIPQAEASDVTVKVSTTNGVATSTQDAALAGEDFEARTDVVVTIPAGSTQAIFSVQVNQDTKFELPENFGAVLSEASPGNTLDPNATTTSAVIQNDDAQPTLSIDGAKVYEGATGETKTMTFTVHLSNPTYQDVTFDWATADGTATVADNDYVAHALSQATIPKGADHVDLTVTVNGDNVDEVEESFFANITNAKMGGPTGTALTITGGGQGVLKIGNDDRLVSISGSPVVTEGNSGTQDAMFRVSLASPADYDVVVTYHIDGVGSLVNGGEDFVVPADPTVTIHAGDTFADFAVKVLGDTKFELQEKFTVSIADAVNAKGDGSTATGTINDDDALPHVSVLTPTDSPKLEGSVVGTDSVFNFIVKLDQVSGADTKVLFSTVDGTATEADGDFVGIHQQEVIIPAGQTQVLVPVTVKSDLKYENTETFSAMIEPAASGTNATITTNLASATIVNDDGLKLTLDGDVSITEGDSGTKTLNFTVKLVGADGTTAVTSGLPVFFNWSTLDGSAVSTGGNPDYVGMGSTAVVINPDTGTATLSVTINGDTTDEIDENFSVLLSNAKVGDSLATATAIPIVKSVAKGTILNDDLTVTIGNAATVTEGDGQTSDFTVTLTGGVSTHDVKVFYTIVDGTAKRTNDLTATDAQGFIIIPAGQTTGKISLGVKDDALYDSGHGTDETFTVRLDRADNAALGATTVGTGAIHDNESAPIISISSPTTSEGDSGTKVLSYTVSVSTPSEDVINFDWVTLATGTATPDVDFTSVSNGHGTIAVGASAASISVFVTGDTRYEADETVVVHLSNAHFGTGTDAVGPVTVDATGTITNDDALPTLSITALVPGGVAEGNSGTTDLVFKVTASRPSDFAIDFDWATVLGTATPNVDFTSVASMQGSIAPGETETTITVKVLGDTTDESDEVFFVNLANAKTNGQNLALTTSQATGRILNDELVVTIDPTLVVTEGNTGTSNAVFTVHLNQAPVGHDVTVTFDVLEGTAKLGSDFNKPGSLTVTFHPGDTDATIAVPIVGDVTHEGDENFSVKLTGATNAVLGATTTSVATIHDNDDVPKISVTPNSIDEGDNGTKVLTFTVSLSNPTTDDVTFNWGTVDGSAIAGAAGDYLSVIAGSDLGKGKITAGSMSTTISVTINGDTTDELDENFQVQLSSVTNAVVNTPGTDDVATGTIKNDDATVRISGGQVTEGDAGSQNLNFAVSLTQPSTHDVVVHLQVTDGTAKAGLDYQVPANLDVTIPAGTTTVLVPVAVLGDLLNEGNETFAVKIASAENAKLGVADATGTIIDNDPAPIVSIANAQVTEGNSGTTDLVFTIHLSAASGQTVTVLVTPQSGTATSGVDFSASAQTIQFDPGQTDKTFVVHAIGDNIYEKDETFSVALSNPSGATLGSTPGQQAVATGTILNDEAIPTISIGDVSIAEGSSNSTTTFNFTITLSGPADTALTFDAATLADTALAGEDFVAKTQTLTIPAGQTTATFAVTGKQDGLFETNEQFFVNLTNVKLGGVTLANPGDTQAVGTILNDDAQPTLSVGDVTVLEGDAGTKEIEFTVTMVGQAGADVTFHWSTANGSAIAGEDFVAKGDTVATIPVGSNSVKLKVTVNGDMTDEPDENFFVNLSQATLSGTNLVITDAQGEAKLLNDDRSISISDVTVVEGNSGETDAVFTVTLSGDSDHEVTVHYRTQDDTATSSGAAADFTGIGDTVLTFAPHQTTQTITVKVKGDVNYDQNDQFKVLLSQATNAQIADAEAVGIINDDGDAKPMVSVNDVTKLENADGGDTTQYSFEVSLDHASDDTVTVAFNTVDGTAKSGSDYTAIANQTVTFAPGVTKQTVVVTVKNDKTYESEETFKAVLSDPSNATLDSAHFQGTGTIQGDSDDVLPRLQITGQQIVEGDNGEKFLTFTIQRIGATEAPLSFHIEAQTKPGDTALPDDPSTTIVEAGSDYLFGGQDITMQPGETTKTVQVKIYGDTVDETNETFSLVLSNPIGATINPASDGTAQGKILNDDLTVKFQQTAVSVTEGNSGQTDMVFQAQLSAVSDHAVTITYNVTNGTATSGTDFQPTTPMQITIPAGQLTGEIRIPIQGDNTAENNETFTVTLLSATDAALATTDTTATGTIVNDDAALSIADATIVEGNSGTKDMVFVVTLKDAAVFPVTVHYVIGEAADGYTAVAGSDFGPSGFALQGDITFNASDFANGVATKEIHVPIIGDTLVEGDEKFLVRLSNPTANGNPIDALLKATADGRIQDDESFLSVNDVTVVEGDTGTKTAVFTITRSPSSTAAATVVVSTLDGTAISTGSSPDFLAKTETISFAAGETTKTFSVTILGDKVFEADSETFKVVLSNATGAVVVDGEGTGTITNSADSAPTISVGNAAVVEGDSGQKMMEFTVSLSGASDSDVTFNADTALATGDTAAAEGSDFNAVHLTNVTIPAGQTSVKVQVPILGDADDEADEQLLLKVSNAATQRIGDAAPTKLQADGVSVTGTGTILNDDLTVSIVQTAMVDEGNSGTSHLTFRVSIPQASTTHDVTVTLAVTPGTATLGSDYTLPNTLTVPIPKGQTFADFVVDVKGDVLNEDNETVNVAIVGATGAKIGDATSVGTIKNDDAAPTVKISDVTVTEGNSATFTVALSAPSAKDVVIKWITEEGHRESFTGLSIAADDKFDLATDITAADLISVRIVQADGTVVTLAPTQYQVLVDATGAEDKIQINDAYGPNVRLDVDITGPAQHGVGGVATGGDGGSISSTQGDFKQFLTEQTLTIPAGQTTGTIVVTTSNDAIDETDETFFVKVLDTTQNATVVAGGIHGQGTIGASDFSTLSIGDASVVEGDSNTKNLVFTVTRSGSTTLTSTVHYSTANSTASASAGDFIEATGDLTFLPGEVSKTITITVNGDTISEIDEQFFVVLSNPVNSTITDNSGTGTILNDEATYKLVRISPDPVDEEAGGGAQQFAQFKVVRTGHLDVQGVVSYSTIANDVAGALQATAGVDFTSVNGTIIFNPDPDPTHTSQESTTIIKVPILSDALPEGDETFKVKLTSGVNGQISTAAGEGEAIVTIADNDSGNLPHVTVSDAHLAEGNSGTADMVFTLKLVDADGKPATAGGPITVTYSTVDGSAIAGEDYNGAVHQTITFNAGESSKEVHITVLGDAVDEADETFQLNLESAVFTTPSSGGNGDTHDLTIDAPGHATGTILNDDLVVSVTSVAGEAEGNTPHDRTFTISIPQASNHDVSVNYITHDGTAVARTSATTPGDYDPITGVHTVIIPAGQTSATFTVTINGDVFAETDESFTIEFTDLKNATMASNSFTATILNDDAQPTVSIGDASIVEGDSGSQNMVFTITLAGATDGKVRVDYATLEGSAKSSGPLIDFGAVSGFVEFDASLTGSTKTISVPIFGDTWKELDETFSVQLSNPKITGSAAGLTVSLGDGSGTGTIKDNGDTTLGVTIRDAQVVEGDTNGTSKLHFTIETTAPVTDHDVTMIASTRAGTAKANDFTAITGQTVTIAVGSSVATVDVSVTGDTTFEQSEFMFLDLKNFSDNVKGVGASGSTIFGRGIILNDDIHVVSAREFEYVDTDGDLVNVKFSKGALDLSFSSNASDNLTFVSGGSVGGRFLQKIDLTNNINAFAGTNIIVTAHPQVLANGTVLGNGSADIGAIDIAVPAPGLFQFTAGVQLGKIVVPGDLGRVIAGNVLRPAGITELNVGSLGAGSNLPTSPTGGNANDSLVIGPIGKMIVNGDVVGSMVVFGDTLVSPFPGGGIGKIGTLVVKGKLKGGGDTAPGRIAFTGGIGNATIGGLEGGTTQFSGALVPLDDRFPTKIGSLTVLGDVKGGSGDNSGYVNATSIGAVSIGKVASRPSDTAVAGNLIGGTGQNSGRIFSNSTVGAVTVNGSLIGGAGSNSGQLLANTTMGRVRITGNLDGGDAVGSSTDQNNKTNAFQSGSLLTGAFASTVTIEGSLLGGSGDTSGSIRASGYTTLTKQVKANTSVLTIGKAGVADSGNIVGGAGGNSAFVNIQGNLSKFTMYGKIKGGTANVSGGLLASGTLGTAVIKGNLEGGSTAATGSLPTTLQYSGFVQAGNISNLTIEGHVESGTNGGTSLFGSGSIASFGSIGTIQVLAKDGDVALKGTSTSAAIVSAVKGITKATFNGDVSFAEVLAGYSPPSTSSARGSLTNAGATIGTVTVNGAFSTSSIVAGVDAGGDGKFGTLDDQERVSGANQPANQNLVSRIASVIIQSIGPDAPSGTNYGIVAERIDSVKIAGVATALHSGPHNDSVDLGAAGKKLKLQEI